MFILLYHFEIYVTIYNILFYHRDKSGNFNNESCESFALSRNKQQQQQQQNSEQESSKFHEYLGDFDN